MKSRATPEFWRLYRLLPSETRRRAAKAYQLWRENPALPGLRFKRVNSQQPIYSIRIGSDYRALGIPEGDTIIWFWIGTHDEYERKLK